MGGSSKKQTVGYKYHLGAHMPFCHGPIDKVTRIRVAEKVAWEGESTGGSIVIDEPGLFGGEDSEGGISGIVDFDFGGPAQTVNTYLQSKQEDDIPAYRGVASAVLNQVYLGTNPYLKPWEFRAQRIHTSTRGAVQWYDDKSEVPGESGAIVSTWDADTLVPDGNSINLGFSNNNFSSCISDDGLHLLTFSQFGSFDRRIISFTLSTAFDLTTSVQDSGFSAIGNYTHSGSFVSSDGTKVYLQARGVGIVQFNLSAPFSGNSASQVSTISSTSSGRRGLFFNTDGTLLFLCDNIASQARISKYDLPIPWSLSTAVFDGVFEIPGESADALAITGKPDGSKIFVGVGKTGPDIIYTIDLSNPNDISTASVVDQSTSIEGFIENEFSTSRDGKYFYKLAQPSTITRYQFTQIVQSGDMNPAHIIRECITDTSWGMGYTDADIDDTSFTAAADTLFDEEFGLSLLWSKEEKIEEFIKDIIRHIDATRVGLPWPARR
jgi:hypothetical protein